MAWNNVSGPCVSLEEPTSSHVQFRSWAARKQTVCKIDVISACHDVSLAEL